MTTTSARELVFVVADEVVEVDAADFLFAFEDELDVHRQRPFCFRCASTALKCMNTWPLSSADPRA